MQNFLKESAMIITMMLGLMLSSTAAYASDKSDEHWKLIWADEFDSDTVNTKYWDIIEGNGCPLLCGFGNDEKQTYTSDKANLRIEDGLLIMEAIGKGDGTYASSKITTQAQAGWLHGKFEMRAKLPVGLGTWPAFWMMPMEDIYGAWPKSGEIDIMEHVGADEGVVHGTIHTETYNHKKDTQLSNQRYIADAGSKFHTYAVEWDENSLMWSIDGHRYLRLEKQVGDTSDEWPFDHPYYMILNLAVGGFWGGAKGIDPDAFPAKYEIDYVRVYKAK